MIAAAVLIGEAAEMRVARVKCLALKLGSGDQAVLIGPVVNRRSTWAEIVAPLAARPVLLDRQQG